MKKKQFESIGKQLLPQLPGFVSKGWLLYHEPVGHVLRGFCCDESGFDKAQFTVWAFCLPLYIPTTHVYFRFGARLKDDRGCDIWWNANDPELASNLFACIESQGLPFLSGIDNPRSLIEFSERDPNIQEPGKSETIAYSAIIVGDYELARSAFGRLTDAVDVNIPWQVEILDRAKQLREALDTGANQAKRLLEQWEQFSANSLGIPNS